MTNRIFQFLLALWLMAGVAYAATNFSTFAAGRATATQPLGASDWVPIIQGGVTAKLPGNIFITTSDSQTLTNKTIAGANNSINVRAQDISTTIPFSIGGLGYTSANSGAIPCFPNASTISFTSTLGANLPVIGAGAGSCPGVGSVSGNTTKFVTNTGTTPSGQGASWDANGNLVANANALFSNSAATITGQWTFNSTLGTHVSEGTTAHTFNPATECGKPIFFTSGSASTITAPNTTPADCMMTILQLGAGQITVTNGGGSNATYTSIDGFTKTAGVGAVINLYFTAAGSAVFFGRGV